MMPTSPIKYSFLLLSFLLTGLLNAQNTISGRILDEKTNKEIVGVEIFINNSVTPILKTTAGSFNIQSDSVITQLKFSKKIII